MGLRLPKTKGMLRREAAGWLARLQSGRDLDIERKFHSWRDRDPRHAEAFERVSRTYEQAGVLRHSAMGSQRQLQPRIQRHGWNPRPALAAAAVVAVLVPVAVITLRDRGMPFVGTDAVMLMTRVGEIRQVLLADGSRLTLDTATKVEVEIGRSRRGARLRYGRARFQIAPGSTPFVVETASTTVTTQRGVVDVEEIDKTGRVQVLAGAAEVRRSDQGQHSSVVLGAGEGMMVNASGDETKAAPPSAQDWTGGMLQFDATPLADAVALANRYSDRHIILVGDLASLKVTGAFRAGDTSRLAKSLAAAFGLSLQQGPDGDLLLSRNPAPALRNKRGG